MNAPSPIIRHMKSEASYFFRSYLQEELSRRLQKNDRYSLRSFSKSLEIDSASLSRILSGKKVPSPKLSRKILEHLSPTPAQKKKFLYSAALAHQSSGAKRTGSEFRKILKQKSAVSNERDLEPEIFQIISDWYHYAILQLIETENFKLDYSIMAQSLGLREAEVQQAVRRLLDLKLVQLEEGSLSRTKEHLATGDLSFTTPAHRKRIAQIMRRSLESLERDPIHSRSHTSCTLAIDPEKIPLAKEMIQTFMDRLSKAVQSKRKQVYELQISFFPLQKDPT